MAYREPRSKKLRWIVTVLVAVVAGYFALCSAQEKRGLDFGLPELDIPLIRELFGETDAVPAAAQPSNADTPLSVHFIDVGQAKAILIRTPEKAALIDAGDNDNGQRVLKYLSAQNVGKIDVLIGTHPHADHIGGLDTVLMGIPVETVILPVIPEAIVPTGATYADVLSAIKEKGLKITPARAGNVYDLGGGARLTVLGPLRDYDDLNAESVVCRLDFGETSFLFTGDATTEAEFDMIDAEESLRADVLDVGHHGSQTSSSDEFLRTVKPWVAVISCGVDNSYDHPHRSVVERLEKHCQTILRTDLNGTIVITSDGESLGVTKEKP